MSYRWSSLLTLGLLVAGLATARADDRDPGRDIIGAWGDDAACGDLRLSFHENGGLTDQENPGVPGVEGHYKIDQGMLTLSENGLPGEERLHVMIADNTMTMRSLDGSKTVTLVRCARAATLESVPSG